MATLLEQLILSAGTIQFTIAAGRIIPGATSFSIRDTANANDNLIVTNAGAVTVRAGLTVSGSGIIVTGNSTITGTLSGLTGLTVASGGATVTAGDLTITAGKIVISTAVSQLVPGATSFSLRNTANNADNLIITDAGAITVRSTLTGLTGLTVSSGTITMGTAASQLIPGATSFSIRDNGNANDNLLVSNAGAVTTRAGLTVTTGGATVSAGPIIGNLSTDAFSGAITITVDSTKGNVHKIACTSNTASTLTPSGAGVAGQHMWIIITADVTGGNVITFASTFKSSGTLTTTASKGHTIEFISDGTNWWEHARTLAL